MLNNFVKIQAHAFYTAIPQLIAQIVHTNEETASIVQSILTRVLYKFPEQAMWPLAWLRQSKDGGRRRAGEAIFNLAKTKLENHGDKDRLAKLLTASKELFDFLHSMAK